MSQPALSPPTRPTVDESALREGRYLTDEANLFRCISIDRSHHPYATVLLEDCLTLGVIILPLNEVVTMSLRLVEPA